MTLLQKPSDLEHLFKRVLSLSTINGEEAMYASSSYCQLQQSFVNLITTCNDQLRRELEMTEALCQAEARQIAHNYQLYFQLRIRERRKRARQMDGVSEVAYKISMAQFYEGQIRDLTSGSSGYMTQTTSTPIALRV